jgi:hypothetical protein
VYEDNDDDDRSPGDFADMCDDAVSGWDTDDSTTDEDNQE